MNQPTTPANTDENESEQRSLEQQLSWLSGWMLVGFLASGLCCYWGFQGIDDQSELVVTATPSSTVAMPTLQEVEQPAATEELVAIDDWLGLKPKHSADDSKSDGDSAEVDHRDLASDTKSHSEPEPAAEDDSETRDDARLAQLPEPPQTAPESNPDPAVQSGPSMPRPPQLENYTPAVTGPNVITELTWDPIQPFEPQLTGSGSQCQLPPGQSGSLAVPIPHQPTQPPLHKPAAARPTDSRGRFMIQPPETGIGTGFPGHETSNQPNGGDAVPAYPSTGTDSVYEQGATAVPVNFQPRPPRRPAIYQASGSPLNR